MVLIEIFEMLNLFDANVSWEGLGEGACCVDVDVTDGGCDSDIGT